MTKLKVLILEDDRGMAELLSEKVSAIGMVATVEGEPTAWSKAPEEHDCDFVVSDLKADVTGDTALGDAVVHALFESHFVPIVVHSSVPSLGGHFSAEMQSHPLVKLQAKGADSVDAVGDHLLALLPVASELRRVRDEVQLAVHHTMKDTVKAFVGADPAKWGPIVGYLMRRRIAAQFDFPLDSAGTLKSIERYLFPPISSFLLTGDVLTRRERKRDVGADFRLVLSPSCDLVWETGKRKPKVETLMVAKATAHGRLKERFSELRDLGKVEEAKLGSARQLLRQLVRGDSGAGFVVLPPIPEVSSEPVVFDLKSLELIRIEDVEQGCEASTTTSTWKRVVSQDSPFREHVTSVFCGVISRPALPEVDVDDVVDLLFNLVK